MSTRTTLASALTFTLLAWQTTAGVARGDTDVFAPPPASPEARSAIAAMQNDIDQASPTDAARQFDLAIASHGDDLYGDQQQLTSVTTALLDLVANAPTDKRDALINAYRTQFDGAAGAVLESTMENTTSTPEQYYAVAVRYPWSTVAITATVAAGDRAALIGDWQSARTFYAVAIADGWKPDAAAAARCDAVVKALTASESTAFHGEIPYAARWYGHNWYQNGGPARTFPFLASGLMLIPSDRSLMAFDVSGRLLWSTDAPTPPSPPPPDKPTPEPKPTEAKPAAPTTAPAGAKDRHHAVVHTHHRSGHVFPPPSASDGPFTVGTLCSDSVARVAVTRLPRMFGGYYLQAVRCSDGSPLWDTQGPTDAIPDVPRPPNAEPISALQSISFTSSPIVVGRMVYGCGIDLFNQVSAFDVVALDINTGAVVWQTSIGGMQSNVMNGGGGRVRLSPASLSLPDSLQAIGSQLVMAPGFGCAIALDRFTGKLHWIASYPTLQPDPHRQSAPIDRFADRPVGNDSFIVLAPHDSDQVIGLNALNGKTLWHNDDLPSSTLIGRSSDPDPVAVLEAETVSALRVSNGTAVWRYDPSPDTIVGPATAVGSTIFVPTSQGIVALSTATGQLDKSAAALARQAPEMKNFAKLPGVEPALKAAKVDNQFGH